jgi:DNA-directed RNA polymerase delta subunit
MYDAIELEFLDFELGDEENKKLYISDYHGQQYTSHQIEFEAISKDEKDRIETQVLLTISNDNRLVSFRNEYFPAEFLVNLESTISPTLFVIAKENRPLSSTELLEKLSIQYNEGQEERWKFSLNYYLNKNRRFEYYYDSEELYWDIRKPVLPLVVVYDKQVHQTGIRVSEDFENLLYYHGFLEECQLYLQGQKLIAARYDSVGRELQSDELIEAIEGLLRHDQCHLFIEDSGVRGDPILVHGREFIKAKTICSTVTIRHEWIEQQLLKIPHRISKYMQDVNEVAVISDRCEERLAYDATENTIQMMQNFYKRKAIAEEDKTRLRLLTTEPEKIFVSMWWRHSLSDLMHLLPEDLAWEHASVRDCIIVTLGHTEEPLHYREIYAEVSQHRTVSFQSIVNTLSKYSPSIFFQAGRGKWGLAISKEQYVGKKPRPEDDHTPDEVNECVWRAVNIIEQEDYVYKVLAKAGRPLTYSQIVDYLARTMEIDPKQLAMTEFLNPKDERFKQLDDGTWALSEWIEKEESTEDIKRLLKTNGAFCYVKRYYWVILLALIGITCGVLIWLFY